jgi:hypothetical protein
MSDESQGALGPTSTQSFQRFAEAYWNYVKAEQEAWLPADSRARIERVRKNLSEASNPEKQVEAYCEVWRELSRVPSVPAKPDAAFREYVEALKDAWNEVDPASLTPWHLAAIARAIHDVAGWAGLAWNRPQKA